MIDPSTSSTIECTIDCGCTTTSIRSASDVEQPARLDHLEPLVHQRRGIDRDLRSHRPGRMPQRVVAGHAARGRAAVRPRNGPPDAVRIRRLTSSDRAAVQALVDRVVLAVDRQHEHAVLAGGRHHERAGHHQDFLVRERDRLAGVDRGEHGVERRGAGRGEQHDVRVGMRRDGDQAVRAARHARGCGAAAARVRAPREPRPRWTASRWCADARRRPGRRSGPRSRRPPARRPAGGRRARRRPRARSDRSSRSIRGSRCVSSAVEVADEDVVHRPGEEPAVDPIEHAAVARESASTSPSRRRCA